MNRNSKKKKKKKKSAGFTILTPGFVENFVKVKGRALVLFFKVYFTVGHDFCF